LVAVLVVRKIAYIEERARAQRLRRALEGLEGRRRQPGRQADDAKNRRRLVPFLPHVAENLEGRRLVELDPRITSSTWCCASSCFASTLLTNRTS
jgi:hypothetical protein